MSFVETQLFKFYNPELEIPPDCPTIEHLVPRALRPPEQKSPTVLAHYWCNYKKGSLSLEEFRQWQQLSRPPLTLATLPQVAPRALPDRLAWASQCLPTDRAFDSVRGYLERLRIALSIPLSRPSSSLASSSLASSSLSHPKRVHRWNPLDCGG